MPFDFKAYDQKCQGLTLEELQREWEHYTRLISGAATSTAVSGCAIPLTLGVSTIGVAMAAPAIHNARKKREIIERHLNRLNATHHTRKRDVLGSMAVSGTIGVVTLGVGTMGADAVATAGAEHGIQSIVANETAIKIVSHAALDGAGMAVEHAHTDHLKKKDAKKAFKKAGVFQAVQDAKAAEAGYSIQPYQSNGQYPAYAAAGPSQALPIPPPPYSTAVGQLPDRSTYLSTPNGYPQDFKIPPATQPHTQLNAYLAPTIPGQQPLQQAYAYSPQQQVPVPAYSGPSPMPPSNGQMFSPPQTPAVQCPPQQQVAYQQQSSTVPYNSTSTPLPFDMSAMQQALPMTPAPVSYQTVPQQYTPMSPPQNYSQNCMIQPAQQQAPSHVVQVSQVECFPPTPVTTSGYPPLIVNPHQPITQPTPAVQVLPAIGQANVLQSPVQQVMQHEIKYQPTTSAFQPQSQHAGYPIAQYPNVYGQSQMSPSNDPNRRDFVINSHSSYTPQPYNPQNYKPVSQLEQIQNATNTATENMPVRVPQAALPPMQYQMPPTPLPTGSTSTQYQHDNKGSYFPTQPQTPQATGEQWQSNQLAYQQYPSANYPTTPMP
ncbi:hypothetical protein ACLX1H_003034 [Fusarium chlamydosporum]